MNEPLPAERAQMQALLQSVLAEQRQDAERGDWCRVEAYLDRHAVLRSDAEAVLDLIYQEMLLREGRGETPTLAEYVGRFPELAESLERQFEIERALVPESLPSTRRAERREASTASAAPGGTDADDYEILQMLGRGGMGVVYKARQRSLNRVVALKMIRDGALAAAEDRQRFRVEAEAAARLQHPNIVQIFEIGERDRLPFLAMEYVDGQSLAERLDGQSWPPREAAALVETLAQAIHHAHQHGIVHRDLKPANILLSVSRDAPAERAAHPRSAGASQLTDFTPKIADFGLAKIARADGARMTETGQFLGTPSYAAPEQVLGRRDQVGPPADVYSLGAILYEMLVGRPPFQGTTVLETMEQVRTQDPPPLSRLGRKLPRDLETICLKCLHKDPRRRYASAALLADDLRRFQEGRTIAARPTSALERFVKLVRRRPAAATAVASLGLAIIILAVGGWTSAINQARLRRQAEANLAKALEAVDSMLTRVAAVELADVPQMEPVRKDLLLKARGFLESFLKERGDDPAVRFLAAKAYARLGDIQGMLLDEHDAAEGSYRRALGLLEGGDNSLAGRQETARSRGHLGVLLKTLDRLDEARQNLDESVRLYHEMLAESAGSAELQKELAEALHDLATVLARLPGQRAVARQTYEEALGWHEKLAAADPDNADFQRAEAHTLNDLGNLIWTQNARDAEQAFARAAHLQEKLVERFGEVPTYRRELARTWNNLAGLYQQTDRRQLSEKTYMKSLEAKRQLTKDFPKVPIYRHELAGTWYNLGIVLQKDRSRLAQAEAAYQEALSIRRQLVRENSRVPDYRYRLALVYRNLGSLLSKRHQGLQAEPHLREAVRLLEPLAERGRPEYQSDLGLVFHELAQTLARQGSWLEPGDVAEAMLQASGHPLNHAALLLRRRHALDSARSALQQAIVWQESACHADRSQTQYHTLLREHYVDLADVNLRLRDPAQAARTVELLTGAAKGPEDWLLAARFLARCNAQAPEGGHAEQAVRCLQTAVEGGLKRTERLTKEDFAGLRDRPDFQALVAKIGKKN
jgi:tetratricopeptide (TPR) repeat protein